MPIHEFAALGTALCWALTALFAAGPASRLGAAAFNRIRLFAAGGLMGAIILLSGAWAELSPGVLPLLILSGLLGITLGDTMMFAAVVRLGPRRAGVLFALNAPLAALFGWTLLGEDLPLQAVAGILLAFGGTALAIRFGGSGGHVLENIRGRPATGIAFGLLAALGQAAGTLILRPLMAGGLDPFAASFVRIGFAALAISALMALPLAAFRPANPPDRKAVAATVALAFLGLGLGMTLMLYALSGGAAGIVATLTASSPVLILPLIWLRTGQRPRAGAWAGAALALTGMALIFTR
jgi:drug/metabolite transporter (DMT)-like permease